MATLKSINYIHTLLVCEFECNLNAAWAIRCYLIETKSLRTLLFQYTIDKCISLLPYHPYGHSHWFFQTQNEKDTWIPNFWKLDQHPSTSPNRLYIRKRNGKLQILLIGNSNTYALYMKVFGGSYSYSELRTYYQVPISHFGTPLTKEEFIEKLETLSQLLTATKTIPFTHFNVK